MGRVGAGLRGGLPQILTECWGPGTKGRPDTHAAVRTIKWKYVEHYDDPARTRIRTAPSGGQELELYDLEKDPFELDNLLRLPPAGLARTGHTREAVDLATRELKVALEQLKKD